MRQTFEQIFATRDWLLADGATGTNFFHAGLETGYPPELWNVEYPDRVTKLHANFIVAGAASGGKVEVAPDGSRTWTVTAAPEGGEYSVSVNISLRLFLKSLECKE